MASKIQYPYIEKPPNGPARLRRIPRVRVAQLAADYLMRGWSPEEMYRHHPYLTIAEAYSAMLYYWDHPREIEEEIRQEAGTDEIDSLETARVHCSFLTRLKATGCLGKVTHGLVSSLGIISVI